MTPAFTYDELHDLCHGDVGDYHDMPCPICSAQRKPCNQNKRIFRVWLEEEIVTFNCVHCDAQGHAIINGTASMRPPSTRRPRPAPEANARVLDILIGCMRIEGTPAEKYLRGLRGITIEIPDTIMYCPRLMGPDRKNHRALIAKVSQLDGTTTAVQVLFLTDDGRKADVTPQRMTFGPMGSGAVQLAPCGVSVGLAEGTETALSVTQMFGVPCWAALGANRLKKIELPDSVERVHIFGDCDIAGDEAAEAADEHFTKEGLKVLKHFPHENYADYNDLLTEKEI